MTVENILTIVSLAFGGTSLGGFFLLRSKVRTARAEAKQAELSVCDKVIAQKDDILEDYRQQKADLMVSCKSYQEDAKAERERAVRERERNNTLQEKMNKIVLENIELRDQVASLQYYKCVVNNCENRRPPRVPLKSAAPKAPKESDKPNPEEK